MKTMHRIADLFRDSPTYGRDRANLISGFTIGTAGLLLNGAVLFLVLPLMLDPDDQDFRMVTENVEFGQLLALILLGGAAAFATLLIPLRLATVFMGPRIGRYFDQIVLSGISPLRFVIGKATSQNLFLALILFLLLPYLVLSITLGGVDLVSFFAGLFLIWLYCMALALVTLWASLYLNELLAAVVVTAVATLLSILGCIPLPFQPFVLTPFPALIQPLYSSIPSLGGWFSIEFFPIFAACAAGLTGTIVVSLLALHLGPLYGIVRDNSTFGEIVRAGDSKGKRRFRLRPHIQRPSEIAFFYQNRSDGFSRNEGLIRWGLGFGALVLLTLTANGVLVYIVSKMLEAGNAGRSWIYDFHATSLVFHGCGMALAVLLFSHAMNTTGLRLPLFRGKAAQVSRLDTTAFLLFVALSTALSIGIPHLFNHLFALPAGESMFPDQMYVTRGRPVNYARVSIEGSLVLSVVAVSIYGLQRCLCLTTWVKIVAFAVSASLYSLVVCTLPVFFAAAVLESSELRLVLAGWSHVVEMASPFTVIFFLFNELGSSFPRDQSTLPFYIVHAVLLGVTLISIRARSRVLRRAYLPEPGQGAN